MNNIILGDNFNNIFKKQLKVEENIVVSTFESPYKTQFLKNDISLYLKRFHDNKLSHLLLCTQVVNGEMLFAFAYWIPRKFISNEVDLLDTLEIFANNFGCRIKISDKKGYFIKEAKRLIQGKLESPNQVMEILGSKHIPCESFLFYKENPQYGINWIDCYYCFAINNNKYYTWLYDIETVSIKVKSEWYSYLSEIRDMLNPYGKTNLKIISSKSANKEGLVFHETLVNYSEKEMELEIPKHYIKPFARINEILSKLGKNEKIAIIPKFEKNKCIFCGSDNISGEHIFAKWMRNYFEEKTFSNTLHTRLPEVDLLTTLHSGLSKGTESSYGYTTHHVCISCNTTWMSQLEENVKAILIFEPKKLKTNLSELNLDKHNAKQIALWITVKAILLSIKSNLTPILPDNACREIKEGKIPYGFLVEIADCETYDLNFIVNKGAFALGSLLRLKLMDRKIAEEMTNDFFMVCAQVGNFLFRVSYFDESKGLIREGCIRQTKVLYPYGFILPYKIIENEKEKWGKAGDNLKLHIFNIGLSLTDY